LSVVDAADLERRATPQDANEREDVRRDALDMQSQIQAAWRDGQVDAFLPALHTALMVRGYLPAKAHPKEVAAGQEGTLAPARPPAAPPGKEPQATPGKAVYWRQSR